MRQNRGVNANFHHVAGEALHEKTSDRHFIEYRKKWNEWPTARKTGDFPLFIDIEVTSTCNLKCPFCATTFRKSDISRGFIDPSEVYKIIDEGAANGLYGVKFNIRGEPLLHPSIVDFVRYAKDKGLIDVYFNTNAMLLDEDTQAGLIEAGLDRISVSFEGYTKALYEKNRPGASYEKVLSNVRSIQAMKKKNNALNPRVRVQTVMLPELAGDFEAYKDFWKDIADEVGYLDFKDMKEKHKGVISSWACPQIWQRMAVWWDGTILPCNHDDDGLLRLGNVKSTSIKEAWHSARLDDIRRAHARGDAHTIAACDGCYLRDSEITYMGGDNRN